MSDPVSTPQDHLLEDSILQQSLHASVPCPTLVIENDGAIRFANAAAEGFFGLGAAILRRRKLSDLVPFDSPLMSPVNQARARAINVHEYDVEFRFGRDDVRLVDVIAGPLWVQPDLIFLTLFERGRADQLTRQLTHQESARSVGGFAAVLAHEIKNPLLGIRGAAQLLESDLDEASRPLAHLIRDESDRIRKLIDQMEVFTDTRPLALEPINIHEVLEHVRRLTEAGENGRVTVRESYDPSLPPIAGHRDQLVQAFLNLVRNACEALPGQGGTILLSTAYRPGFRMTTRSANASKTLPLEVRVTDNGVGISPELMPHLFDPFVTTKPKGPGLGFALVARVVGEHGGVIDCDAKPGATTFRVLLPAAKETAS